MVGRKDKYGKPMGKPEVPDNRDFTEKSTEAPLNEYEKRDRADKGFLPDGGGGYDASGEEIPEEEDIPDVDNGLREVMVYNGDELYSGKRLVFSARKPILTDGGYRDSESRADDSAPVNPLYREVSSEEFERMDRYGSDDLGENSLPERSLRQEARVLEEQGGNETFLPPEVNL